MKPYGGVQGTSGKCHLDAPTVFGPASSTPAYKELTCCTAADEAARLPSEHRPMIPGSIQALSLCINLFLPVAQAELKVQLIASSFLFLIVCVCMGGRVHIYV